MSSYDSAAQLLHAARASHHAYVHAGYPSQIGPANLTVGSDPTNVNPIPGLHPKNANWILGFDLTNANSILGPDSTNANLTVGSVRTNANWSDDLLSLLPSVSLLQPALERARHLYGQLLPPSSYLFHRRVEYLTFPISSLTPNNSRYMRTAIHVPAQLAQH